MIAVNSTQAIKQTFDLFASPAFFTLMPLAVLALIGGGRARPVGIVAGFIASFTLFVLYVKQLLPAVGLDGDNIHMADIATIGILGLALLNDDLRRGFRRQPVDPPANDLPSPLARAGGAGRGLVIGVLLGAVLAFRAKALLTHLHVTQELILTTLMVALLIGIAALVAALLLRRMIGACGYITRHSSGFYRLLALMLLAAIAWPVFTPTPLIWITPPAPQSAPAPKPAEIEQPQTRPNAVLRDGLKKTYAAPELIGIDPWLNGEPTKLSSLKGKVVLIHFWSFASTNSIRDLTTLTKLDQLYRDKGLAIIGIHAPTHDFEKNLDALTSTLKRYAVEYPIAVDNKLESLQAFDILTSPTTLLINQKGQIIYVHVGQGGFDIVENNILSLLDQPTPATPIEPKSSSSLTPLLELGYQPSSGFNDPADIKKDETESYRLAAMVPNGKWTLGGKWKLEKNKILSQSGDSVLRLSFAARKVYAVMGSSDGKPMPITISLNGRAPEQTAGADMHNDQLTIDPPRVYELINQPLLLNSTLEININAPGLELYSIGFAE